MTDISRRRFEQVRRNVSVEIEELFNDMWETIDELNETISILKSEKGAAQE